MVTGIGGKYCAGKNTVARILAEHGYEIVDVDELGHDALRRRRGEVRERFGERVISGDGSVDRRALGTIVFSDRRALRDLEGIVHPEMRTMVSERIQTADGRPVAINAALLFSMELDRFCDVALWVTAPLYLRLRRARSRDRLSLIALVRRFWAQRHLRPQPSGGDVDIHTVRNSGNVAGLSEQLRTVGLI